eukprot:TRINITY_DN3521_c0_g1_i1.p1 TRINITY_DN3521_c0_g1~~TRINITY_DN3521_c0_g1_i1.p1  ORF type:complete len:476 (-),score=107.66 TRINITY_DN3521_c0_g1_i1:41-1468(-)
MRRTATRSTLLALSKNVKSNYNSVSAYSTADPQLPPTDFKPQPYTGPSYEEVANLRKTYLNPAIFAFYKKPLMVVEGKMQYLWDEKGRRYLDMIGGIVTISVGHCHPRIVEAAVEQTKKLMHSTTIYYNPEISEFARDLAAKLPDTPVIYFVNSGSDANDLAMLMARLHTGNQDFIGLRNGYHGMSYNTMGLTALNTWKYPVAQGLGIKHALTPDTYRGIFKEDDPDACKKYVWDVKNLIETTTTGKVSGFIAEYIQGVGGTVQLPDGYLSEVYKVIRSAGGVCISDEVQTGFGRTGTHYWGYQTQGVKPDIVTMAKGIGNGTPLAAVATTAEIAKSLTSKVHFNTYGGNPVSCAIGKAVLKVIDEEGIQQKAHDIGNYLLKGMRELQSRHKLIGDVRGLGLMTGMELVKDRVTKEPATAETAEIFEICKEKGLLVGKGGLYGNVFRIKPPMCISKSDVDFAMEVFDQAFKQVSV